MIKTFEKPVIYIVVPCYFEEEVLPETAKRLRLKYDELINNGLISIESRIVFVNDGSKDRTWDIITDLHEQYNIFTGISLSRNFGHQNAVYAGLMSIMSECDAAITMDADLQDDINAIDEMIKQFRQGYQIVYGVRKLREKDSWFKRNSARCFYKFMKSLGADVIYDHADFRLMSRKVLFELSKFKESNLFLRGIMPLIGFSYTIVYYDRNERFAGKSKYSMKKMLSFAWNGITALSISPLHMITKTGIFLLVLSVIFSIYTVIDSLCIHFFTDVKWVSMMCTIWFFGSLILFCIGLIGEYVGKTYMEQKERPRYIIGDRLD